MPVSKSSRPARSSKRTSTGAGSAFAWPAAFLLLTALAISAAWFVWSQGRVLFYGDAEAHLNIARRVLDSRTPGPEQIGTVWLPLPHLAMLPLVMRDELWRTGLAGTAVGMAAFIAAGLLLFGSVRRVFGDNAAGFAALGLFALNPNVLYLSAIPMTEPLMFLGLSGLLFTTLWFRHTGSWWAVIAAALFSNIASLTRYEGWFLIPFVAAFFWIAGGTQRWLAAGLFAVLAALAPLAWLAHNQYYYSNALEFYNGPYSAKAIYQRALQGGMARYPGDHDWAKAVQYFAAAAQLCAGWGLVAIGALGAVAAVARRAWWPLAFLALPPLFYILSLYSSGTPIFVPQLWPSSYYNTRYGLAAVLLLAFSGAALTAFMPARFRAAVAAILVLGAALPWAWSPVITWKESQVNSDGRRAWTAEAASMLQANYRAGDGIITSFGDLTGIYRAAGIPLREVLHEGNMPAWDAAVARPELLMHEEWAIAFAGDKVATALQRPGVPYRRVRIITSSNAPVLEIYRRYAHPLHQSPRSEERLPADVGP